MYHDSTGTAAKYRHQLGLHALLKAYFTTVWYLSESASSRDRLALRQESRLSFVNLQSSLLNIEFFIVGSNDLWRKIL
jgi:hypothetical protein